MVKDNPGQRPAWPRLWALVPFWNVRFLDKQIRLRAEEQKFQEYCCWRNFRIFKKPFLTQVPARVGMALIG